MARKKDYGEIIAEHIAKIVEVRKIEHVLHFTRLENLPYILEFGLRSRSELVGTEFGVYPSDLDRLDQKDDAVSVSISCYYPRMFDAKRHRAGRCSWAILILQPSILWKYHCLFYRHGVPTNATKYESGKRYGGFALEKLFEDYPSAKDASLSFRAAHGLPQSWPTFPDSEVQVMSPIHPSFIMGAWVETSVHGEFVSAAFEEAGRDDCEVVVHPFEPRLWHKPYFWG